MFDADTSSRIWCEKRSLRTEIDNIGGSLHTVPAQAMVITLGRLPGMAQDTITAGTGLSSVPGDRV